jgi:hypothetical protein
MFHCNEKNKLTKRVSKFRPRSFMRLTPGRKWFAVTNALDYNTTVLVTKIESFISLTPVANVKYPFLRHQCPGKINLSVFQARFIFLSEVRVGLSEAPHNKPDSQILELPKSLSNANASAYLKGVSVTTKHNL